jgi:uncharacterized lipoprotein
MRYLKSGFGLGLAAFLSACSHTPPSESRFAEYAQTSHPLVVPAGIKNPTGTSYYPVPPVALKAPVGTKPPLAPPGSHLVVEKKKKAPASTTPSLPSPSLPVPR